MEKYISIHNLIKSINDIRKKNMLIGFTNGCFDLLHSGHIHLLNNAKIACDYLIVAVNSDLSVKSIKGESRPIQKQQIRIDNLSNLSCIDAIISFEDDTPLGIIKILMPDILFKGSDYQKNEVVGSDIIEKNGGKVILIDHLKGYSTTNIIKNSSI